FLRTLEDRGFLARRRIAGDGAADSEAEFTAMAPFLSARDYLLTVFRELAKLPGAADLFDARHNPVWVLAPSADGAGRLLDFFRKPDKKGNPPPDFDGTDTRFLGDLYQNLSEEVRKRYALLQTPEFVEEFILEQTLDPAIAEFGLGEVRLIDPTCGSGHFLLGAFRRLYEAWLDQAPGEDRQVLAQRALGQVHGVDINPYAVAIARFRLTLEFLQTVGITRLDRAPRLPLNLCVADSLLHGVTGQQAGFASVVPVEERKAWGDELFALEDEEEALRILGQRYHAVVGNPPYIKEADTKKRRYYLELYESAFAQFALSAPFTERFFGIGVSEGFVGMINANSFTKRDFGETLIKRTLSRLEITQIIDTSGAYIPGHGTPTLLLFGRNRPPGNSRVLAVLGKRGEAQEPNVASKASVWTEIAAHYRDIGFDGRHVSVEEVSRDELSQHPWIMAGGGARQLKKEIDHKAAGVLAGMIGDIGFSIIIGQDAVYIRKTESSACAHLPRIPLVAGDDIRDWTLRDS
ncbi:MAG: BREX-2 system adenine-specific DNA-methyltransferase PglX, partial [bacterium]|nr:BREX-2 system adenine-specific DNA-methyltransferase PglX [bacterium]